MLEVNASRGETPPIPWFNAYSWILVAGQAVDRGFTVEGLTVTYMPRGVGVGNADTLQQRGRFFGYKAPYLGYCRIYLPADVAAAYHDYVEHEEDVRQQLREYEAPGRSLDDWKRAFVMAPTMRPTRQNVLRLDYMRGLLSNDWFYPAYPLAGDDIFEANRALAVGFLRTLTLTPDDGHPDRTPAQRHQLAKGISLARMLRDLLVPLRIPASTDTQRLTGVMLQLRRALDRDDGELCDIYVMSPGETRRRPCRTKAASRTFSKANTRLSPVPPRIDLSGRSRDLCPQPRDLAAASANAGGQGGPPRHRYERARHRHLGSRSVGRAMDRPGR